MTRCSNLKMFTFIVHLKPDLGPGCDAVLANLDTVKENVSTFLENTTLRHRVHEIDNQFRSILVDRGNFNVFNIPIVDLDVRGLRYMTNKKRTNLLRLGDWHIEPPSTLTRQVLEQWVNPKHPYQIIPEPNLVQHTHCGRRMVRTLSKPDGFEPLLSDLTSSLSTL